jgi:hypothetical protein
MDYEIQAIFLLNSILEPSIKKSKNSFFRLIKLVLLMIKFLKIFHHKILFQQQMNKTMMLIFDVVDLYHKIDEIHQERKVQDHQ